MDFKTVARIATLLSKSFAEDFMRLLVTYRDISASEAASRLDLHIKTAQDFLEELTALEITSRQEVYERKRPYFRYTLEKKNLSIDLDFTSLYNPGLENGLLESRIRERKNSGALFSTANNNSFISAITVFSGEGRKRRQRKISLTTSQGKFLYHLPFPNAAYQKIEEIIQAAGVKDTFTAEIIDIINILRDFEVIEFAE